MSEAIQFSKDYNQVADSLQDAIFSSDLAKAADVILTFTNQSKYKSLFHNSSDPTSLLELIKGLTEDFENISNVG